MDILTLVHLRLALKTRSLVLTAIIVVLCGSDSLAQPPPSQLLNISTRLRVLSGDNALIGGFIITGADPKKVIIRGLGPSLGTSGIAGALTDPTLELYQGSTFVASNDNWKETQQAEIASTGIPPSNDLESAIVRMLTPGNYTAIVRGKGDAPGIGLVEAYDLDQAANSKLANISTRGFVDTGDNVMIGGLIVGPAGGASAKVVVRAIGPTLSSSGVSGALQDPMLDLVNSSGVVIRSNNNWKDIQQAEIAATGIPPQDDRESAIVELLAPGNYTAIVRGNGNTTGVGLVEVYNLDPNATACVPVVTAYPVQPGSHVPSGTVITSWNSNPPSSGQHYPIWAKWNRVYDASAPIARSNYVHNLEHGGVVLLFNCPNGCSAEVSAMQSLMAGLPSDPTCTAPGVSTRTLITADPLLPSGVTFAAVAWGFTYTANCFDGKSLRDFVISHLAMGPENTCANGGVPP